MTSSWQPLDVREGHRAPDGPYEGVPAHLGPPLIGWTRELLGGQGAKLRVRAALRLRLPAANAIPGDEQLLVYLDALLHLMAEAALGGYQSIAASGLAVQLSVLQQILQDGESVWRLVIDRQATPFDMYLERRVPAAELEARDDALAAARTSVRPAAAEELAAAWRAAYALHPNPSEAYRLAIVAVEHAVVPLVEPTHAKATLGTVLGELRGNQKDKWSFDPGTGVVLAPGALEQLLSALWQGQVDRHGGQPDYSKVTQEQAEAAVRLAVILVRWITTGALTPRPAPKAGE